jgi:hypothetical protein
VALSSAPSTATDNVSRKRLSDRSIARLVKEYAALIGLDPSRYAGHSLRAGLATSAADGSSARASMRQTGHRSPAMGQSLRARGPAISR